MSPVLRASALALIAALAAAAPQPLRGEEALRGEVVIDIEPLYGGFEEGQSPPEPGTLMKRAFDEASRLFSGMIYGWSFYYDIGERARGIKEQFEMKEEGGIGGGEGAEGEFNLYLAKALYQWAYGSQEDWVAVSPLLNAITAEYRAGGMKAMNAWESEPPLRVTDARLEGRGLRLWAEYIPDEGQRRRLAAWKAGSVRSLRSTGSAPLGRATGEGGAGEGGGGEWDVWSGPRRAALEDAARAAVRAALRGSERNRPRGAAGFIALGEFPRYYLDSGRLSVSALFFVDIREVIPFPVY